MIRFNCDYSEGAHSRVLDKLIETNLEQTEGYGEDRFCKHAAGLILQRCGRQNADVHFLAGGTQTNLTFISAVLCPHQGVISADTGHINVHESGAIEATGHKVLSIPNRDGKLTAQQIQSAYDAHHTDENHEHMVQPKLVYISNATEAGTIYTKKELTLISETCRRNGLILYLDGARLGYALCAEGSDLDLPLIADLCDAFYIGGTKNGLLFGEALVICNDQYKQDFRYIIKQHGAMLAKGRVLGIQFAALFEDNLYFELAAYANRLAMLIREACMQKGYSFLTHSTTNQQFPIMPNAVLEQLNANYEFSFWQRMDENHSAVRFCTSWATREDDVKRLVADIKNA